MRELFNRLNDGVIVFSRNGAPVFMNEPVMRWVAQPRQPKNTIEKIWHKVSEALEAGTPIPSHLMLELSRDADGRWPLHFDDMATLTASPAPAEVVLLLRPTCATEAIARTTRGLKEMLDDELSLCLSGIFEAIDSAAAYDTPIDEANKRSPNQLKYEISAKISAARNILTDFDEALKLSLDAPLIDSQRLLVGGLIEKVVSDVCTRTPVGDPQISVHYRDEALAPVYGSSIWLEKALTALLRHMLAINRSQSKLTVNVRQYNNYLQLAIKQKNAVAVRRTPKQACSQSAVAHDPHPVAPGCELSLTVARKVIEAHGGALKVFQDMDGFADIQLQLPTGRPASDGVTLQQQLECYAHDLNQVLKNSRWNDLRNYAKH